MLLLNDEKKAVVFRFKGHRRKTALEGLHVWVATLSNGLRHSYYGYTPQNWDSTSYLLDPLDGANQKGKGRYALHTLQPSFSNVRPQRGCKLEAVNAHLR